MATRGRSNPLQYSFLENSHGQRSQAGYSPWGHKESDTTKRLSTAQSDYMCVFWFYKHKITRTLFWNLYFSLSIMDITVGQQI